MRIRANALWLAALVGVAGGCVPHVYVPTDNATARLPDSGTPAASYPVPADAPRGNVQVATLGARKLKDVPGRGGSDRRVLVVRYVVTNNSDQRWRLDPGRQMLTFADGERVGPAMAYGSRGGEFVIGARTREEFDLLFDVPPEGSPLDHVELAWAIDMPDRLVTNRSDFRREEVQPPSYYAGPYAPDLFYGPPAWYYPYPWYGAGFGTGFGMHEHHIHEPPIPRMAPPVDPPPGVRRPPPR